MGGLQVSKLVLLPRVSKAVNHSLKVSELQVEEHHLQMTPAMREMHQLLIEILSACIDEAKSQFDLLKSQSEL